MRESVDIKGRRYLIEGRLQVLSVNGPVVQAICRGNGQLYRLGHDDQGYFCDCPARSKCSHLVALQLVVANS